MGAHSRQMAISGCSETQGNHHEIITSGSIGGFMSSTGKLSGNSQKRRLQKSETIQTAFLLLPLFFPVLLCCLCLRRKQQWGEITAASKKTGDLSRQALATIYGDVVNNPLASSEAGGVDTILASIFQVLNGALLVVGSLWACYIIFRVNSHGSRWRCVRQAKYNGLGTCTNSVGVGFFSTYRKRVVSFATAYALVRIYYGHRYCQFKYRCRH